MGFLVRMRTIGATHDQIASHAAKGHADGTFQFSVTTPTECISCLFCPNWFVFYTVCRNFFGGKQTQRVVKKMIHAAHNTSY